MINEYEPKQPLGGEAPVIHTFKLLFEVAQASGALAQLAAREIRPLIQPYLHQKLVDIEGWIFSETREEYHQKQLARRRLMGL